MEPAKSFMRYTLDSPEFLANPYPIFDEMRRNDPIFWNAENNYWILTRYADIASQTQNDQLSSNRIGAHSRRMPNEADRKSTRLNSSHVEISYAVFCLKKKTPRNPP